jgi:hypothetical protein
VRVYEDKENGFALIWSSFTAPCVISPGWRKLLVWPFAMGFNSFMPEILIDRKK